MIDCCVDQLGRRVRELQCRDQQLSQSTQHITSLHAQLEQTTDNVERLQSKLDSHHEKYDNSTRQSASLQSEIVELQNQLSSSQCQVIRVVNIAIKVSLSLVSAILLEYRHQYCQYFLKQVSLAVSPIHFQPKSRYSSAIFINGESATTHSVATCTNATL